MLDGTENIELVQEEKKEYTTLNLGPTHPATHGIFQNVLKMDGEKLLRQNQLLDTSTERLKNWQSEGPMHKSQQLLIV